MSEFANSAYRSEVYEATVDGAELFYIPEAYTVRQMEEPGQIEQEARDYLYGKAGELAMDVCIEADDEVRPTKVERAHLLDNLRAAREGNEEARKLVDMNAATAIGEAMFKTDQTFEIFMERDADGELTQFGQTNRSIQQNSVKYVRDLDPVLQDIRQSEVHNAVRIQRMVDDGTLQNGRTIVAASLVPNGLGENKLDHRGAGYFTETLSYSLQATTMMPDGRLRVQTAFMAGVEDGERLSFEQRMANRHDFAAIAKLYARFGLEAPSTAAELLNEPLVLSEQDMPNGITDIMYYCDRATDEVFGRYVPRDVARYTDIYRESELRANSLLGVKQAVVGELLARSDEIDSPMEAVKLMWSLIKDQTVAAALTNRHIDPRVFGREARQQIEEARVLAAQGDVSGAMNTMERAKESAVISGCGGGSGKEEGSNGKSSSESRSAENGSRSFSRDKKTGKRTGHEWPTHKGECIIPGCPTKPNANIEVGPCDICIDVCQPVFDSGGDPTTGMALFDRPGGQRETRDIFAAIEDYANQGVLSAR